MGIKTNYSRATSSFALRRAGTFLLLLSVVFFSCRQKSMRERLIGKWHSVRLENKDVDSFFIKGQQYLDTIGKNNDNATNLELYGTTNMDSLRRLLQEQYDSAKNLQLRSVTNTIFSFRKDSILSISFNGNEDTCKWTLEPDKMLVVQDMNAGGGGDKMTWEILELTDTSLVLKMKEDTSYSKVTFHPEGKKS